MKRLVTPPGVIVSTTAFDPRREPLDHHAYSGIDGETSPHDMVIARSSEEKSLAFRLRYRVLIEELHHQTPEDQPSGLETDAYDARAAHALLVHRASGRVSGTVRIVLATPGALERSFPIQELCTDPRVRDPDFLPLARTAEVSRFILAPDSRGGRFGDGATHKQRQQNRIRVFSLTVGLIKSVIRMSVENEVLHLTAIMAPSLLRMLARLGIHFHPIGPAIDYNGIRQPCHTDIREMLERTLAERPDVWEAITADGAYWEIFRDYA